MAKRKVKKADEACLVFARTDKGRIDVVCGVVFGVEERIVVPVLTCLKQAVTAWVRDCKDGAECWKASCEDLNIGDLLGYFSSRSLRRKMREYGILYARVMELDGDYVDYDTHLCTEDPNGDDEGS